MRKPLIAGNWKMNTTVDEAKILIEKMLSGLKESQGVEVLLCPPFISLQISADMLKGSGVALGAQNMHFEEKGAYTGEISPLMIKDICRYVILGHSERRHIFGESDEMVNKKVLSALTHTICPILCVGETLEENETGKTEDVIGRQVRSGLSGVEPQGQIVVAYEPVWAIGTGRAATVEQAESTIILIRDIISELWGSKNADEIRILYGGSVTTANIGELIERPDIDGALVGGASLKADDFRAIVRSTADIYAGL